MNFPFICSNIPVAPAYGVYISQLIRYSRACGSYLDFRDKELLLTRKLLNQGLLLVKLKSSLRQYYAHGYEYVPFVVNTTWSFPHSWLITGFVIRLTPRVPLVEQKVPTLPEHLSSPQMLSRVRVTRYLALCVCFVGRRLSFCAFSFGYCVVCSSSIYGFWWPLWYLQALLITYCCIECSLLRTNNVCGDNHWLDT